MKKVLWFTYVLVVGSMLSASSYATSPVRPTYVYGAIAYQTIPKGYYSPATYRYGTCEGRTDAYAAAREAQRDCGSGCGYFTFHNGCAGIVFTSPLNGNTYQHGFLTHIEPFRGNSASSTRSAVRRALDRKCDWNRVRCSRVITACTW